MAGVSQNERDRIAHETEPRIEEIDGDRYNDPRHDQRREDNRVDSRLPLNRPRTSATAAGVPRVVASTVTASPTQTLSQAEESQSARAKKLRYHRRLNPGGGKLK